MAQVNVPLLKKILLRVSLVLAALLLLAVVGLFLFFEPLARMMLAPVRQQINGDVKFSHARLGLGAVRLSDVSVTTTDGEPVVSADEMLIDFNLRRLLTDHWARGIDAIVLTKPGLRLVVDKAGQLNLAGLFPENTSQEGGFLSLYEGNITLEDGYLIYRDARGLGLLYEFDDVNGFLDFDAGQADLDLRLKPMKAEKAMPIRGTVHFDPPGVHLRTAFENLDLTPFTGLNSAMIESGRVSGDLTLHAQADSWGGLASEAFAVGQLELHDLSAQAPGLPVGVEHLEGKLKVAGRSVKTDGLTGQVKGSPFKLWGEAGMAGLNLSLTMPELDLARAREVVPQAPAAKGRVALDATIEGTPERPEIDGLVTGQDLRVEGRQIDRVKARFELVDQLLTLKDVQAEGPLGSFSGSGLAFLRGEPGVVLHLQGQNARVAEVVDGVADRADFSVAVVGTQKEPLVFGQGSLSGLGAWSQGLTQARGRFLASRDNVVVYQGSASGAGSRVDLPFAVVSPKTKEIVGSASTNGFAWSNGTASANLAGRATFWGDLDELDSLRAVGQLEGGTVSYGGYQASGVRGPFAANLQQLLLPELQAEVLGGSVELAAEVWLQQQSLDMVAQGSNLDLNGSRGDGVVKVLGRGDGAAVFAAAAEAPNLKVVAQGNRRPNGTVRSLAWVDALQPGQGRVIARGAGYGTLDDLRLVYNGTLQPTQVEVDRMALSGEGRLRGNLLALERNLLTWETHFTPEVELPVIGYHGHAYDFIGPQMAPPLEPVLIESFPFPGHNSVLVNGTTNLARRNLDFNFIASGLDLGWLATLKTINLPFQVESGLASARGHLGGSWTNPMPTGRVDVPWMALSRPGAQQRYYYSMAARLDQSLSLLLSGRTFDPRLGRGEFGPDMVSARGQVAAEAVDLRLKVSHWPARELALLAPESMASLIPWGLVSSDNLHLWGSPSSPSLAGTVELENGGLRLADQTIPIELARLDFSGQQGEIRLSDLLVQSGQATLRGQGKRSANGTLEGDFWTEGFPLARLPGGLKGQADAAVHVEGSTLYVAFQSEAVDYQGVTLEELVFGQIQRQDDQLTTDTKHGVQVRMEGDRVAIKIPEGGLHARLEDSVVSASGAMSAGIPTQPIGLDYLTSPQGPDFGRGGVPFRAQADHLTDRALALLTGQQAGPARVSASGVLTLEGQWYRDHLLASGPGLPSYRLDLENFEAQQGERRISLEEPTTIAYQRDGTAGRLVMGMTSFDFYHQDQRQGHLEGEGNLALMQAPEARPESELHLGAGGIPLASFLPDWLNPQGTIDSLEVNLSGPLLRPELGAFVESDQAEVGGVPVAQAVVGLASQGDGRVSFEGPKGQPANVFLGPTPSPDHALSLDGWAEFDWRQARPVPQDRLAPVWQGRQLRRDSQVDMQATLVDKGLALAQAILGESYQTAGNLEGNLSLEGQLNAPDLTGRVQVSEGQIKGDTFGELSGLNSLLTFDRIGADQAEVSPVGRNLEGATINRYSIESFQAQLNGQPIQASGKAELVGLEPVYIDARLFGKDLPLRLPDLFNGKVSVDTAVEGRPSADGQSVVPVVVGSVDIPKGDITLPVKAVEGEGVKSQVSLPPVGLDLDVSLGEDVWAKAMDSTVRVGGDLQITRNLDQSMPSLFGTLALSRGTVRIPFSDIRLQLRTGEVRWTGPVIPELRGVIAQTDLSGYRIYATVSGVYPDLKISYSSQPYLTQSEISRLLVMGGLPSALTGETTASTDSSVGGFLTSTGTSYLTGLLTNSITEGIGRAFSLTEVSFDYIPPADYVIKIAKALDN
ncbi:MAG: translocation/assembly module TamB domain-containing protein, partial [Candidatus Eremiobacteraeota bacterium]|nr:translocation/assembly module TamB domain-containing protein [Candidatus Eremiobacteraeota bacterium]